MPENEGFYIITGIDHDFLLRLEAQCVEDAQAAFLEWLYAEDRPEVFDYALVHVWADGTCHTVILALNMVQADMARKNDLAQSEAAAEAEAEAWNASADAYDEIVFAAADEYEKNRREAPPAKTRKAWTHTKADGTTQSFYEYHRERLAKKHV